MIIKDEGYVLKAQKYGEKALLVTLFTLSKGKITGFVSNGSTKKNRGLFQTGNKLFFEASSRLEENMPRLFRLELMEPNAVMMIADIKRLQLMTAAVPMMLRLLNENEETFTLYQIIGNFFHAQDFKQMLTWYAYFEFYALEYLGLGLTLDCCAVTGQTSDLAYVSPKTGKAVCREVGAPYHDRLFSYPHFIVDKNQSPSYAEIFNVLEMTEFFLKENFFKFHNLPMPESRSNFWLFKQTASAQADFENTQPIAVGF
ncbi:MAG: DNA repair protein RecO [Alphaproteobacteria bacterium]|nr:DNA repair protein RecO [Alphaproteobacteria bacterium]